MIAMLEGFSGMERFFALCAIIGGTFLFVRLLLQFFGLGAEHSFDSADAPVADGANHGSDIGFKLLSLQGLTAFFLMFGLVGLALFRQTGAGILLSILGATIAGLVMVAIMSAVFNSMKRLQSSGNVDVAKAIGSSGTVYANIPNSGTGQVQLCIQDRLRIYDAVSRSHAEIKTGERIKVVEVSGNTMIVEKIDN